MFGLMVRFTCKDEDSAAAFDILVGETIEAIRQHEPGTIVYASHQVDGEPLQRIFYELYRDRTLRRPRADRAHQAFPGGPGGAVGLG